MKLENRLFSLELDLDMISFKIGLIVEDLEEELNKANKEDAEKIIETLASLQTTRESCIELASKRINELRKESCRSLYKS